MGKASEGMTIVGLGDYRHRLRTWAVGEPLDSGSVAECVPSLDGASDDGIVAETLRADGVGDELFTQGEDRIADPEACARTEVVEELVGQSAILPRKEVVQRDGDGGLYQSLGTLIGAEGVADIGVLLEQLDHFGAGDGA